MNISDLLKATGFRFNKALGQNFITDNNLLSAIVADSKITSDDVVVEIGTGAGTLTRAISNVAKKVYSFEVDQNLKSVLELSLKGVENAEVIFRDVLKLSDDEFNTYVNGKFKVVANLPYYITTPLLMRFLESNLDVESLTLTVQKEVADRFVAVPNTSDYSQITLAIQMVGNAVLTRKISKQMFYPVPKVDSAVVRIDVDRHKLDGENTNLIHKLVKSAFKMRRKTLVNNLAIGFGMDKQEVCEKLEAAGFSTMVRGEVLSLQDYIKLSHFFN